MVKRFGFPVLILVSLFIGSYFLGASVQPQSPSVVTTNKINNPAQTLKSPQDLQVTRTNSTPQTFRYAQPTKKTWSELRGGDLYHRLFNQRQFTHLSDSDITALKNTFSKPYPQVAGHYQAVMVERLGILKALEQQTALSRGPASNQKNELKDFYMHILNTPKEHWIVKRQAFKNAKTALTIEEKTSFYKNLDSRVVALATKSELEIVQEALNEKR